ncbi:Microbial collagenase precursor [Phycisphaerae bacterium RAS1]|nr:Microbial collagenase precursor [Phycisphaerae bacterium RAS1]
MPRWRCSRVIALCCPLVLLQLDLSGCPVTSTTGGSGDGGTTNSLASAFNREPNVVLQSDLVRGIAPLTVQFSSAGSTDDGLITKREWVFGDGGTSQELSPVHTFASTGTFTVTLTLTDDDGATATDALSVTVTKAPIAVVKVDRSFAPTAPATIKFDGSESRDPDGTIVLFSWDFADGTRATDPMVDHRFAVAGTYRVRLTVTDNAGVTASTDRIVEIGIAPPTIEFRSPPAALRNVVVSQQSPLWAHVKYDVAAGVPRFIRCGLRDPVTGQEYQLDTFPPQGEDLNLTTPTALSVAAVPPGAYQLWVELRTDRTEPTRVFNQSLVDGAAQLLTVNVVPSFTDTVSTDTPVAPLVENTATVITAARRNARQIFDLGPLNAGDQLSLGVVSLPGYQETFALDRYSVQVMDADQNVFAWFENTTTLFPRNAAFTIGHNSDHYYVAVDASDISVFRTDQPESFRFTVTPNQNVNLRGQKVILDFAGRDSLALGGSSVVRVPEFGSNDDVYMVHAEFGIGAMIGQIVTAAQAVFADYDVEVSAFLPGDPEPQPPFIRVYFGRFPQEGPDCDLIKWYTVEGAVIFPRDYVLTDYYDPRNTTLTGTALVLTDGISGSRSGYPASDAATDGVIVGRLAARAAAYLMGLRATVSATGTDLMDPCTDLSPATAVAFERSPLRFICDAPAPPGVVTSAAVIFTDAQTGQILNCATRTLDVFGMQDASAVLLETVGPRP